MRPTPEQLSQLRDAMLSAFPSHSDLAQMMYFQFGINLDTLARGNLTEVVFGVISWADSKDRIPELVTKARRANETSQALADFENKLTEASAEAPETTTSVAPELQLLPSVGHRLDEDALRETRQFLFKGHGALGRFFTLRPTTLFGSAFIAAAALLLVPAYLIGVALMEHAAPGVGPVKVGFLNLRNFNWWLMYPVVLPLLFAGTVWLSNYMRAVIIALTHRRVQVIRAEGGGVASDFSRDFADRLARFARPLFLASMLVTLVLIVVDMWDLFAGYYHTYFDPAGYRFAEYDWSVAFTGRNFKFEGGCPLGGCPPGWGVNLTFVALAYLFQGTSIFLGIFWTFKFWLYLLTFSRFMNPQNSTYRFNPMVYDPRKRLGLYPMGRLFNGFILLMIVFQSYIFGHRLQQIQSRTSLGQYALDALRSLNPAYLLSRDLFRQDSLDPGMVLLLVFITIPIIIVCYFPILSLRGYVKEERDKAYFAHGREYEEAKRAGDEARAALLQGRIELLKDACVWPNGDAAAKRFLIVMFTLAAAAVFPPLLLYGALFFGLHEVYKFFAARRRVAGG